MVSTTLKAEWRLDGADSENIVAGAEAICAKVREAGFLDSKAAKANLSAEEQERLEEAEMVRSGPAYLPNVQVPATSAAGPFVQLLSDRAKLSDRMKGISFAYVATLSDKQRKSMLSEAYAKAKAQAAELAEVAGMRLGFITSLNGTVSNSRVCGTGYVPEYSFSPEASWNENETVSPEPDKLQFVCEVSVTYRLVFR